MAETVSNIHVGYVNLKDNARAHIGNVVHIHQAEDRCLPDLRNTDPRDDKARIEDIKGGLLEDSYRWILEHSDFQQWLNDERSRLLWIRGDPGKGKTMLLCGIVNDLSHRTRSKDQNANALHVLSYFFCQAADERINSATAVLRGLIYLIVDQQPRLVSHIQKRYKHVGDALFKDINAWTALSEIFLNILEDMDASLQQTYIIIDALDECVTDLPKLLDFITIKSALFSRVKWIVSSRNWPDIKEHLDSATQQISLCLELNENSISAAVSAYIKHQVKLLAQKKQYNEITKDTVQRHLSSNSNNTFLWVALVCQNLEKISLQTTIQKLNEFPPGLNSLYKRMMQQIHKLEHVSDIKFCCQILATVLHVYRPITLAELGILIKCPDADLIYKAIGFCGSFLTVRDSQVYIIHQSAKDYLSDKAVSNNFLPNPADIHGVILSQSVQVMSSMLRRNIYNLHSPSLPINEIKAPDPDPLETISYSCLYWIDHFCDIYIYNSNGQSQNQVDDEKCQMALLFLQKYFLYWLEALGLMGHIEDSVLSIIRLESLLRGNLPDRQPLDWHMQLLNLSQDSKRFIWRNSSLIANNPLQVYTSALIFSPINSLVRKIFQEEEPQWLKITPTVEYNWGPYLQTLRGHNHWVTSVAFSPDSRYVVSGSLRVIKIWDATTGKEQQTLHGHSRSIESLACSPDGRYLVSGSDDKTIKIWDIITGKEQRTIQDGLGCLVTSVAFSPDGRYLASGLDDKTIKVWDATTGKNQQTLQGHRRSVTSIAFSPDGHYLASGSEDKTIKIWDATEDKEPQTLQGHTSSVTSVAFSPDGHYLASGSRDTTIHIWNIKTARVQKIFQGHIDAVLAVAFSAHSIYLASGSKDKTIKIWDITTGKSQTFQGHSRAVTSVTFSANGYLASGSDDTTVKIWDITDMEWDMTDGEQQILQAYSNANTSLSFSPNGRYLATASNDKTIRVWDTTGKNQKILRGHSHWVKSVAFSADGRYLASASHDTTVRIWDIATCKEQQTLRGHSLGITSLAFSADGRYLASGSPDNIVKIWVTATGKEQQTLQGHRVYSVAFSADGCYLASGLSEAIKIWDVTGKERQTLQGHSDIVTSVAFSLDGRYLASGSYDETIRIWDIIKGKELQVLQIGTEIRTISFDDTTSYLHTEVGLIHLGIERCNEAQSVAAQVPGSAQGQDQRQLIADNAERANYVRYGLSTDKFWITWNGHNIVWLPPDYQPSSMSAIWGLAPRNLASSRVPSTDTIMALGNDSGRVTVVRMSGSGPHPLL
ncbi:hypothetical protein FP744_10004788 [Trichoderma asperellum]